MNLVRHRVQAATSQYALENSSFTNLIHHSQYRLLNLLFFHAECYIKVGSTIHCSASFQ